MKPPCPCNPCRRKRASNTRSRGYIPQDTEIPPSFEGEVSACPCAACKRVTAKRKAACSALARAHDSKGLRRKVDEIESHIWRDKDTAYFLTPAANEYLAHGTVTIKIGPAKKKAAPDAE